MSTLLVHCKTDCPFYVPYPLIELCRIRNKLRYKADHPSHCVGNEHPMCPLMQEDLKHIIVENTKTKPRI